MGLLELFVEKARVKCCEVTGLDHLNCEIGNIRHSFAVFGSQGNDLIWNEYKRWELDVYTVKSVLAKH